jgi:hypothetical protein
LSDRVRVNKPAKAGLIFAARFRELAARVGDRFDGCVRQSPALNIGCEQFGSLSCEGEALAGRMVRKAA